MKNNIDIAIVGGGVIGSSIAYNLCGSSSKISLFEKSSVGDSGATASSGGLLRVFDPDPLLSRLAHRSMEYYLDWSKKKLPGDSGVTTNGMLYLASNNYHKTIDFCKSISADYPIDIIDKIDVKKKFPYIKTDNYKYAIYENNGGYGDVKQTAKSYINGAIGLGLDLHENCFIKNIIELNNGWRLFTDNGVYDANYLVIAGGAYSNKLINDLAYNTRTIAIPYFSKKGNTFDISIINEGDKTFSRPFSDSSFLCGSQEFDWIDNPDMKIDLEDRHVKDASLRAVKMFGPDIVWRGGKLGFDAYTDTFRPLFGPYRDNVFVATGFSGRGYKLTPYVSYLASEFILNNYIDQDFIELYSYIGSGD